LSACVAYLAEQQKARESRGAKDTALHARESLVHVLLNHNDFVTIR
jgi:hypothetical protein